MVWTLRSVAFARRWSGGGKGLVLKIFVFVSVEGNYFLVACSVRSLADGTMDVGEY